MGPWESEWGLLTVSLGQQALVGFLGGCFFIGIDKGRISRWLQVHQERFREKEITTIAGPFLQDNTVLW